MNRLPCFIFSCRLTIVFFLISVLSLNKFSATAQAGGNYSLSGFITDFQSGEALSGVAVTAEGGKSVYSDKSGHYHLTHQSADSLIIYFSAFGYDTSMVKIAFTKNADLSIKLKHAVNDLKEIVLNSEREKNASGMSSVSVPLDKVQDIPAILGEKDVFKVIQLMPGVQKGSEGSSALYVRGGGGGENLILLDDVPVYNAFHLFGFFSVFNGDALKSVDVIKGGFPAHYGGRLSSVIDLKMKEGHKEQFKGEGSIGLVSSRLTIEGPVVKNKCTFIVSGRRTYIDALVTPFLSAQKKNSYYFYDLNGKISFTINTRNKITLSGYTGKDNFSLKDSIYLDGDKTKLHWQNSVGSLSWKRNISENISTVTSLNYSGFYLFINETYKQKKELEWLLNYSSRISDLSFKHDYTISLNSKNELKTGIQLTRHTLTPVANVKEKNSGQDIGDNVRKYRSLESGIYIEDEFRATERLRFLAGLRLSVYALKNKLYALPEPRVSMGYRLTEKSSLKLSFSKMNQYQHMLSNSIMGLPADLWVPVTDKVKPSRSSQVAAGMVKDFSWKKLSLTIEGYYKKSNSVAGFKEGSGFRINNGPSDSWENNITTGKAWSYGAEFLLRKQTGKLSGWIGYTLSWSQLQFADVNLGEKFFARYDRRHDVSVVSVYRLTDRIKLSATWVFATGNAFSLPQGQFFYSDFLSKGYMDIYGPIDYYSKRNNFRMKSYHRADLGIQFEKHLKKGMERIWEFGVYNVYNRKNVFYYYSDVNYNTNKFEMYKVIVFPLIPSINYRLKF